MLKMKKTSIKYLKDLTQLCAISGKEDEVRNYLKNAYTKLGLEVKYDELGSIVALKKSDIKNAPRVLVISHMDEVGFVVKQILKNGFILVNIIGGLTLSRLPSSRLILKTRNNKTFYGTISALAPHLGTKDTLKSSDLYLDFGFSSDKEAIKKGVCPNDMVVEEGRFIKLSNNRFMAKAFDDRYGCALGLDLLDALKEEKLPFDLYVGATVQEEVGCRGAITLSHMVKPDICVVLDCSPANDQSGSKNDNGRLGDGVLLRYLDRGTVANRPLLRLQQDTLDELKLPSQFFTSPGRTDASEVQMSHDGILVLSHCVVARNIHSPSSIIDGRDYESARLSLIAIMKKLDAKQIEELRKETIYGRD